LSINDTPGARATFARFHVATAETTYTVGAGAAQRAGELIVSNVALG
jgi:DNA adenine methylase